MRTQDVKREHLLDPREPIRGGYELPGVGARKNVREKAKPFLLPWHLSTFWHYICC